MSGRMRIALVAALAPSRGPRMLLGLGCLSDAIVFAWITFIWARALLSP